MNISLKPHQKFQLLKYKKQVRKKKTETENNISANTKAAEALRATESDVRGKKSGINVVFITAAGFALLAGEYPEHVSAREI